MGDSLNVRDLCYHLQQSVRPFFNEQTITGITFLEMMTSFGAQYFSLKLDGEFPYFCLGVGAELLNRLPGQMGRSCWSS